MQIEKITSQVINTMLETFFNSPLLKFVAAGLSAVLGIITSGHEAIIALVFSVYIIDLITGVAKAIKHRNFASARFFKGATKLLVYGVFLMIGAGLDIIFYTGVAFVNFFFAYIFITDSISILENIEELGFCVPIFLVRYLDIRRRKMVEYFTSGLSEEDKAILLKASVIKAENNLSSLPINFETKIK